MVKSVAGTLFGSINLDRADPNFLHTQLYNLLRELWKETRQPLAKQ